MPIRKKLEDCRAIFSIESLLLLASLSVALPYVVAFAIPTPESFGGRGERVEFLPISPEELAQQAEREKIEAGGKYYKPLRFYDETPGVSEPKLFDAAAADLPNSTLVIGVVVDGKACALVLSHMSNESHIVNLMLDDRAVSASYCGLADCVRVLTDDAAEGSIPLNIGGLDIDDQLVFELRGERYGQCSTSIPLRDLPFTRTTWGAWKHAHPSTKVWLDPQLHPTRTRSRSAAEVACP